MITNNLLGPVSPVQAAGAAAAGGKVTPAETTEEFGTFLQNAIDGVAAQEKQTHRVTDEFIIGQADVSELMIVANQSMLTLQLTTQVRNKVIEAYQEVMRMQV